MGLPATALLANNGKHQSYPFYVWLADEPDGPIWRLMDRAFDDWDHRTGEHLAFFVDPFQRREWGVEFLRMVNADQGLADEVLAAKSSAQRFYRERLSTNLAQHLRIGREFLPAAIVSLEWDAPSAAVCFLKGEDDLPNLFDDLIRLADSPDRRRLLDRPDRHRDPPSARSRPGTMHAATRRLATVLGDRFDVQTYDFPRPLAGAVESALDSRGIEYFVNQLRSQSERSRWVLGVDDRRSASGFGISKAYVALSSLDDLVAVAVELEELVGRVAERYRDDPDVHELRRQVHRLRMLEDRIAGLSHALRRAADEGDESAAAGAFDAFEIQAREFDLVRHLVGVLGPRTFGAMQPASREAVAASELIYLISRRMADLRRDMTAVLVGYWKASELEGRRVMLELFSRRFHVAYEHRGTTTTIERHEVGKFTLGNLRAVFHGLRLAPRESAPSIPSRQLATILASVTHGSRNRYTHNEVLTDPAKLERARNLMGCKNPVGLLPLLMASLEAVDPALVPDVSDEPAPPDADELRFMRDASWPESRIPDRSVRSGPQDRREPGRPEPRAERVDPNLPTGHVGVWGVTEEKTKKGGPILQLVNGTSKGILHPRSAVPESMEPGATFSMRVVTGGAMFQLDWVPGEG